VNRQFVGVHSLDEFQQLLGSEKGIGQRKAWVFIDDLVESGRLFEHYKKRPGVRDEVRLSRFRDAPKMRKGLPQTCKRGCRFRLLASVIRNVIGIATNPCHYRALGRPWVIRNPSASIPAARPFAAAVPRIPANAAANEFMNPTQQDTDGPGATTRAEPARKFRDLCAPALHVRREFISNAPRRLFTHILWVC
jgi:hypothetical protein